MADQLLTGTTLVENTTRSNGDAPVGTILAWAKSLTGVPSLPIGWVECDGQVLTDPLSSLNGQTIPDLNGGEFLEGRATSGATGGSATMAHTHTTEFDGYGISGAQGGASFDVSDAVTTGGPNPITSAASNTENRPPFYTVVWIMRVR